MASATLPSYPAFDTDKEISSLPQKWEEWIDGLENLLAAVDIADCFESPDLVGKQTEKERSL